MFQKVDNRQAFMKMANIQTIEKLPIPDWDQVRKIYKKLSDEFHLLTQSFDISISEQTKMHLDHLIIAIDEVDTCIDSLPTQEERDSITSSMIEFLSNDTLTWSHPSSTELLPYKLINLKAVIQREQIFSEFIQASKSIFHYTEIKRHTFQFSELVNYIQMEGRATAQLPLSILEVPNGHPFSKFFTQLCELMGIADLIFDAAADYRNHLIAFKPSLNNYLQLHSMMIRNGFQLLRQIPRRWSFVIYCLRFTWALIKG